MKSRIQTTVDGLIMNDAHRSKGSANIDGKEVAWDEAYQITLLPIQEKKGRVRKYSVAKDLVGNIEKQLAEVNWGAYISLEMSEDCKTVIAVNVICDWAESLSIF